MSKQSWKGSTLLNPEPPVLVSCGGMEKPNLITIGWTGTICTQPSMVSISVRPERYSHHLIKESGQFAINLPTESLVRAVDWCGVKSGRDNDKSTSSARSHRSSLWAVMTSSSPKSSPATWTNPFSMRAASSVSTKQNSSCTVTASICLWAKSSAPLATLCGKRSRGEEETDER